MTEKQFTVTASGGIHARPAYMLVDTANEYEADLVIVYHNQELNLKSVLGVMSLGIGPGDVFAIRAEGEDGEEALRQLEAVLKEQGLAVAADPYYINTLK